MVYLFAYGTLMDPLIQRQVLGRVVPMVPDAVLDFGLGQIRLGSDSYRILVPERGQRVEGWVLTLTPDDLTLLDAYETTAYVRCEIQLVSGRTVWVYGGGLT